VAAPSSSPVNDPDTVRREYADEQRFLARRLTATAELHGPLVEDLTIATIAGLDAPAVLEVGCGTGDFTERVRAEAGVPVVACDLSQRMAILARDRGLPALAADIAALPFPNRSFRCVLANRVLYHLPDLDAGLAEIARVIRPGGALVAVTYSAAHLDELWHALGHSQLAALLFSAENGEAALRAHFTSVERHDVSGRARFATRDAVDAYLDSYGEFRAAAVGHRLAHLPIPFHATYRHSVFVASAATA